MQKNLDKCPICKRNGFSGEDSIFTPFQAASHFCSETRNPDRYKRLVSCIARLWDNQNCHIKICADCGFSCGDPYVAGDEEFYGILHEQAGYPNWKWDFEVGARVATEMGEKGNVIDVGAGIGAFLVSLDEGWKRFATEGSEETRSLLRKKGVVVFPSLVDENCQSNKYQLITIFQVLEHLVPANLILDQCRKIIDSPNGRLIIAVPNGPSMRRQELVTGSPDMPPNHINRWTHDSLRIALSDSGFEVIESLSEPWRVGKILGLAHLKIIADATNPRSLAAKVYRINNRLYRKLCFSVLAVGALLRMLPKIRQWPMSGSIAVVAKPC